MHDTVKQSTGYSKLASTAAPCKPAPTTAKPSRIYKGPAPDWLWSEDRQLKKPVFAEIQALSGCKFTLDAAALDDGSNTQCTEFCSPANSFLDKTHTGHIWINAPFSKILSFVQHYLHCKQLSPDDTSACRLIPGYLLKPLRSLLTGMRLLKRFSKGAELFTAVDKVIQAHSMPGVHWPIYIFTDIAPDVVDITVERTPLHGLHHATVVPDHVDAMTAQQPSVLSTDKHLTMLLEGQCSRQRLKLQILMDTGASCNFVSPRILAQLKMSYQTAEAQLRLADNSEAAVLGKVSLRFKIRNFAAAIPC